VGISLTVDALTAAADSEQQCAAILSTMSAGIELQPAWIIDRLDPFTCLDV
jgi:hypothetical protein